MADHDTFVCVDCQASHFRPKRQLMLAVIQLIIGLIVLSAYVVTAIAMSSKASGFNIGLIDALAIGAATLMVLRFPHTYLNAVKMCPVCDSTNLVSIVSEAGRRIIMRKAQANKIQMHGALVNKPTEEYQAQTATLHHT